MKRPVIALIMTASLGGSAFAQDGLIRVPTGVMPGAPAYWNWGGFYVGGHAGYGMVNFDPGSSTRSMIADILRNTTLENEAQVSTWPRLRSVDVKRTFYGGFVGYNTQWLDMIVGVEVNYNSGRSSARSSDSIGRSYQTSTEYLYDVSLDSSVDVSLSQYGAIRSRFGYAMGPLMPYAAVGLAVGVADIRRRASVDLTATDVSDAGGRPPLSLSETRTETKKDAVIYGINAGIGVDYALTHNIFVRAEYDFVRFFNFRGTVIQVQSGRIGAGLKF